MAESRNLSMLSSLPANSAQGIIAFTGCGQYLKSRPPNFASVLPSWVGSLWKSFSEKGVLLSSSLLEIWPHIASGSSRSRLCLATAVFRYCSLLNCSLFIVRARAGSLKTRQRASRATETPRMKLAEKP